MFFRKKSKPEMKDGADAPRAVESTAAGSGGERRASSRHETTVLTCPFGDVADVSRTGMRVRCGGVCTLKAGQTLRLEISSPTDEVEVSARVVRVRSSGYGRHEIGLAFDGVDDATGTALENLARFGTRRAAGGSTADRAEQLRRLSAAMKLPDHYGTLGIKPNATMEQVQAAYRALARKYHPDLNKEDGAERMFCAINEANDVLSDAERRREYDLLSGHAQVAA